MTWRANFAPSDAGYASISMPHGTAPSSPEDGDMWTTTGGVYARVSGVSVLLGTGGGTPLTDGDKGDITVSGSGASWTIDNNVVTFAKMQDISTEKLIGKHTSGSGDPEQVGLDGGLEFFGANIRRSALTGAITASAGSNTTALGSFTISQLNTAVSDADVATTADLAGYQPLDTQLTSVAGLGYTGNALKVVRVNAGETDFELATPSGGAAWGSITGTLSSQTDLQSALDGKQSTDAQLTSLAALSYTGNALKVVRVNAGETDFELATPSGGGGLTAPQIASLISIRF